MLMMVLGATTASGRLLFGKIVQLGVLNRLHMHQLSMVVTGTGVMMLPLIKSYIGIEWAASSEKVPSNMRKMRRFRSSC